MSEIKVNKITPRVACGTTQLGDSGDTFTIPSGVTISNSGTAAGFGGTGEISWDTTVKTTGTFTPTAGVGYFLNTTGGVITVNLPAGTAGDSVALADYAGTWETNAVTVTPNGSEFIGGINADAILITDGQSVTFVYIDGTQGWVNVLDSTSNVRGNQFIVATGGSPSIGTICGDCKVHKFTGPGTFCVSQVHPCAANNLVSYMVVAGGGGAGSKSSGIASGSGGGGGAGGFRETKSPVTPYTASPLCGYATPGNRITVSTTPYAIVVGGGGAASPAGVNCAVVGTPGEVSSFSTITSAGGGGGGSAGFPTAGTGDAGGSGGGGGGGDTPGGPGAGDTPSQTPAQGTDGGNGGAPRAGGGGGGGTIAGAAAPAPQVGGEGGSGAPTFISGSDIAYAGGGAGGGYGQAGVPPTGPGGGGVGGYSPNTDATAGTVNTGGGGGGSGGGTPFSGVGGGGTGGSGIVYIRYKYQ